MKRKNQIKEKSPLLNDSYLNNILQPLRRQYSESETVKLIEEENTNLRIENGKLRSYSIELEDRLKELEEVSPADLSLWKFEKKRDIELNTLKSNLEKARKEKNDWERKYFNLLSTTQQK